MANQRPLEPVAPVGMEVLFFYPCPFCGQATPTISPTQPTMLECNNCHKNYPILPVDEHGLHYMQIMLAGGKAAVDPDFI